MKELFDSFMASWQSVSCLSHIARYAPSRTNILPSIISGVSDKVN